MCISDTEVDTVRLKAILANMCACIQMSKWTYNPPSGRGDCHMKQIDGDARLKF